MLQLICAGLAMQACFIGMVFLGDLRQNTVPFLILYVLAFAAYSTSVHRSFRRETSTNCLRLTWILAIVFRVTVLLTTPPTLSDDVNRYIWDGRVANAGISPYAYAVNSPALDWLNSPQRSLVNNNWMASPYLPVAQTLFTLVYWISPDSPLAFQITACVIDLLTGWLVYRLLSKLQLPRVWVLIYLWNPLVIVEFAHGAHVDALMIFLMMLSVWLLLGRGKPLLSALVLAVSTLTKGIPVLLVPVLVRRWGWRSTIAYVGVVVAVCIPFGLAAGWGIDGPPDGTGLFGALRIYGASWNYNSSLYHWLEVLLSGYPTPGAAPWEIVGWQPTFAAKLIVVGILGYVAILVGMRSRHIDDDRQLLHLSLVPLTAYLLLTPTVHPWYVTLIIPLLPFLPSLEAGNKSVNLIIIPLVYLSGGVVLSYLTYLDPANLREYAMVRVVEYVPMYLLLAWSAWRASGVSDKIAGN
ncbi:MAG: PIG-U family protein [Anaerolineae bacterium]|nr:PIG-U family protein [Anaerolineae bacterium]